jgi:hypothetical protein
MRKNDWIAAASALLAALAFGGCAHTGGVAQKGESSKAVVRVDTCTKPVYPRGNSEAQLSGE